MVAQGAYICPAIGTDGPGLGSPWLYTLPLVERDQAIKEQTGDLPRCYILRKRWIELRRSGGIDSAILNVWSFAMSAGFGRGLLLEKLTPPMVLELPVVVPEPPMLQPARSNANVPSTTMTRASR
jgi:hypothetical protein